MRLHKKIADKIGIDKTIAYISLARILQGFGSIVTVIFIARYLTGIEQGFYYTFASILAIQIFFELGLAGIITQYVAHENSHLQWSEDQQVTGNFTHISRLASLLRFCLKWYPLLSIALIGILIAVGIVFFTAYYKAEQHVNWMTPWLLLCLGTTLNFLIAPVSAFLEGLGRVKEIAKYRFWAQLAIMSITWSGLFFGAKLYVGGIASIVSALLFGGYIFLSYHRKTIATLLKIRITDRVNYRNEIFPFQWKIALSWVSGYFIFQLFNPVLFATEGAVVAGQMGMTLAALNAILSLTMSWISTKIPKFSGFIAQKNYVQLDVLFNKTLWQSSAINLAALLTFLLTIFAIRHFDIKIGGKNLGDRFLPYLPMFFMMVTILLNHIVAAWATYLRCHKREPMMVQSITIGVLCSISTIFLGKYFGVIGMTAGYMTLVIIGAFWTYNIFITKKHKWHNE